MHRFGDTDKFQLRNALKKRIIGALMREYKKVIRHDQGLANKIMDFVHNVEPIKGEDPGRIPAGNLVHSVKVDKCREPDRNACLLVAMRMMVMDWWDYLADDDDKARDTEITKKISMFETLLGGSEHWAVQGDVRNGYYLGKEK